MNLRDAIYAALLLFIGLGILGDWYFWNDILPAFTMNDAIQIAGIIALTIWWQSEDAAMGGHSRSRAVRIATILLVPLGLAIYLLQTRPWWQAATTFMAMLAGALLTILIADLAGGALFGPA